MDALFMQLIRADRFFPFCHFGSSKAQLKTAWVCRSRDRGFRDPNTGGARLAPTDVVRKSLSNKNAALASTINRTGLNIQQNLLGKTPSISISMPVFYCWVLVCSKNQVSQRLHAEKGLTPRLVSVDTSPSCLWKVGASPWLKFISR